MQRRHERLLPELLIKGPTHKANLTSFGDTFLVSSPRLPRPEVILLLYTFDTSPFNVTLFFKQDPSSTLELKQELAYIGRMAMRKTIQRYQAFTINYCDPGTENFNSSLTGIQ
ncbi:hypothetical protein Btru_017621 [Bulinus truncatus]|nr:hypothetical protein Btru_017621 [Bulinus truncatus]